MNINFEKKGEPQEAVFCVRFGFAGGPSTPVVDCESGELVEIEGMRVFVDDVQVDMLTHGLEDISGIFRVSAVVTLSDDVYEIELLGPDDEIVSEKNSYIKLHIDELRGIDK